MTDENSSGQFSLKLCNVLDVMGYSQTQIKESQKLAENLQNLFKPEPDNDNITFFIVGSKKEGLSIQEVDDDIDFMKIWNNMRCFQMGDAALHLYIEEGCLTFLLRYEECPPGYAMLEADYRYDDEDAFLYIRSTKSNKRYFSSEMLNWTIMQQRSNKKQTCVIRGPLSIKSSIPQNKNCKCLIERRRKKTRKKLKTMPNEYEEASKRVPCVFMNTEKKLVGHIFERQRHQKNESADELHERNDEDIINGRKGQVDPCITTAEKSIENDQQVYSDQFEDGMNIYSCRAISNADIDDKGSESHASLQSNDFFSGIADSLIESKYPQGPSITTEFKLRFLTFKSTDIVTALPALCPDYMHQWSTRKRFHNFPTVEQIERICKMEAHVVPVGCKETTDAGLQWRICFTMGEVELIQSLNGIQLKMYVLLKMLAKNVIKPECPGIITSYVMKNVVLWMAELKPRDHFREENLENCLIEAVHFLRLCVRNGFLPNYMIHSRNLLQGRLSLQDRGILLKLLGTLVKEKGNMVMRCEKVRQCLNCPYISRLFKYTGKDTQLCADVFRIFLKPALLYELADMEDVFAEFLISVERGFDKQAFTVKIQSMVLLKYIRTWITDLPYKSPERIEKRSQMRRKCEEVKKRLAMSVAIDRSGYKTWSPCSRLNERLIQLSAPFIENDAAFVLEGMDRLGTLDNMGIMSYLMDNFQGYATTTSEAQQTGEKHACQHQQYSDLDLD